MATNERKKIVSRLKEAREYLGLSQQEVADKLKLPRTAISQIENGQRGVEALELKALARVYQRPVTFFTGEEEPVGASPDVEMLARQVKQLTPEDRETLLRYAEFLVQKTKSSND
jgi:transcriptional regulator with XRE-family HTH domain